MGNTVEKDKRPVEACGCDLVYEQSKKCQCRERLRERSETVADAEEGEQSLNESIDSGYEELESCDHHSEKVVAKAYCVSNFVGFYFRLVIYGFTPVL